MKNDRSLDHSKGTSSPHILTLKHCERFAVVEAGLPGWSGSVIILELEWSIPESFQFYTDASWGDWLGSILEWPLVQWGME